MDEKTKETFYKRGFTQGKETGLGLGITEETVEFVNKAKVPVMGYKILAAGAIEPKDGFKWAFENGADFICVGMFDFQIVKDVNICLDTLNGLTSRKREWFG